MSLFLTDNSTSNFRVRKHTLNFGVPLSFRDYDRQVLTYNPQWYWRIAGGQFTSLGTSTGTLTLTNVTNTSVSSLAGYRNSTVKDLQGASGYHIDGLTLPEEFTISCLVKAESGTLLSGENAAGEMFSIYLSQGKLYIQSSAGITEEIETPSLQGRVAQVAISYRKGQWAIYAGCKYKILLLRPIQVLNSPITLRFGCSDAPFSGTIPVTSRPLPIVGAVERVSIFRSYLALEALLRLENMAVRQVLYSPSARIDSSPISLSAQTVNYSQLIDFLKPVHRYKMDGAWGAGELDKGVAETPVNAVYAGAASSNYQGPAGLTGKAIYGDVGNTMDTSARLFPDNQPGTNLTTGFTMLFWTVQGADRSRHSDDLLGFTDYMGACGVLVTIKNNKLNFHKKTQNGTYAIEVPEQYLYNIDSVSEITPSTWSLCAMTVDEDGYMKVYMNGTDFVSNPTFTKSPGIRVGLSDDSKFRIGHLGIFDTAPQQAFSDVMFFDRALTAQELSDIYSVGRYGRGFASSSVAQGSDDLFEESASGYSPTEDPLPSLGTGVYIEGCTSFDASLSIDELISGAMLYATPDSIRNNNLEQVFGVGDYVVIEHIHKSLNGEESTGWVPVGHFLVESPFRPDEESGKSRWALTLRTVTKLLSEPLVADRFIAPDIISHKDVKMQLDVVTPDEIRFKAVRPDGSPYYNWSNYPTPVVKVRNFRNLTKPDDTGGLLNVNELPSKLNIRGQKDSVDFNTRTGVVRFDRTYYEDSLGSGMGDPDPETGLTADFDRYRTYADIAERTIEAITSESGVWEVGIADPPTVQGICTLFVNSGNAASRIFKLHDPTFSYEEEENRSTGFTECTQLADGQITWGANILPSYMMNIFLANGGPPSNALQREGYSAYTQPNTSLIVGERTNSLHFSGIARVSTNPTKVVEGIKITVHRWAAHVVGVANNPIGIQAYPWAGNSPVDEHKAILTINGVEVGNNKATPGVSKTIPDLNQGEYWYESVEYGGDTDLWGLPSLTAATLAQLGFNLQAQVKRDGPIKIGVDGVDVLVKYSDGTSVEKKYRLLDIDGGFVNPVFEGLAVGDRVTVGNVNSPDQVISSELLRCGFQKTDPDRPLYFGLAELPQSIEIAVEPAFYSLDQKAKSETVVTEALSLVPPSYMLLNAPEGTLLLQEIKQSKTNVPELPHAISFSINNSDRGVFTQLVATSNSGESVDILNLGQVAVRAYKMDNLADGILGSGSAYGKTYLQTVEEYEQVHAIIRGLFDSSMKTPAQTGNGWQAPGSWGVIYAQNGSHVWPWTMENEELFCIDIGQLDDGVEYTIEALKMVSLDSYFDGEKIPQQVQVYYMDSLDYAVGLGYPPPPTASQTEANNPISYMPEAAHPGWKLLLDASEVAGEVTFEMDQFRHGKEVKIRFLKVVCINAQYRRGPNASDKQARFVLSDLRAYTSRKVVATSTLGVSKGFNTPSLRLLLDRLRIRAYVLEPNGYLDNYNKAKAFADNNLGELIRDIVPAYAAVKAVGIRNGETYKVWSPLFGRYYTGVVQSVKVSSEGVSTIAMTDYNAEWFSVS